MEADGHGKLGAFFEERIHAGVVGMHAGCFGLAGAEAVALVVDFADAASTELVAAFEFLDGGRTETRFVVAGEIETTPDVEAIGILRIFAVDIVEFWAGSHGEDDGFLDTNFIHVLEPLLDLLGSFGIGMGVHVDDGKFGLGDFGDGNFVDGFRAVVFEEKSFWGMRREAVGQHPLWEGTGLASCAGRGLDCADDGNQAARPSRFAHFRNNLRFSVLFVGIELDPRKFQTTENASPQL